MTVGLFKNGEFVTLVTVLFSNSNSDLINRCWGVDEFGNRVFITAIINTEKAFSDSWIPIKGLDYAWMSRAQSWRGNTLFATEAVEL
jgi:hypothetical protein